MQSFPKYMLLLLVCFLLNSCKNKNIDLFTYETINDQRHLEVTKMNMVNLYQLSNDEIHDLLIDLGYEVEKEKGEKIYYIQKSGSDVPAFQLFILKKEDSTSNKTIDITWTSLDKKDRFEKLFAEMKRDGDKFLKNENEFIIKHEDHAFFVRMSDLGVGKSIAYFSLKMKF